jgi:hypothetical protein
MSAVVSTGQTHASLGAHSLNIQLGRFAFTIEKVAIHATFVNFV